MNNKEAIELLTQMKQSLEPCSSLTDVCADVYKALDLAIVALAAYRNCGNCIHNVVRGNMRGCEVWDCTYEPRGCGTHDI